MVRQPRNEGGCIFLHSWFFCFDKPLESCFLWQLLQPLGDCSCAIKGLTKLDVIVIHRGDHVQDFSHVVNLGCVCDCWHLSKLSLETSQNDVLVAKPFVQHCPCFIQRSFPCMESCNSCLCCALKVVLELLEFLCLCCPFIFFRKDCEKCRFEGKEILILLTSKCSQFCFGLLDHFGNCHHPVFLTCG